MMIGNVSYVRVWYMCSGRILCMTPFEIYKDFNDGLNSKFKPSLYKFLYENRT